MQFSASAQTTLEGIATSSVASTGELNTVALTSLFSSLAYPTSQASRSLQASTSQTLPILILLTTSSNALETSQSSLSESQFLLSVSVQTLVSSPVLSFSSILPRTHTSMASEKTLASVHTAIQSTQVETISMSSFGMLSPETS